MQAFPIRHTWMGLGGIFLAAFIVRALVFYTHLSYDNNYLLDDSADYRDSALQIAAGTGLSFTNGTPMFHRVPGYSLFLAFLYKLKFSVLQSLWLQIFLASSIPLLLYFLALTLYPANILLAYAAAVYSIVHIGLVIYSNFLMSETLFIIFLLLFLLLFLRKMHLLWCNEQTDISNEPFIYFFITGLLLGCASLVRAVGPFLLAVSLLLILLSNRKFTVRLQMLATLSAGWLVMMVPWLLRNYILLNALFFHTLPGAHFLYLSAARVVMRVHDLTYKESRTFLENEVDQLVHIAEEQKGTNLNEIEKCRLMERLALHYFTSYPLFTLKTWMTDIMRTALSLFSAELLYLDHGRQGIDYFKKDRTIWSLFTRYFFPETSNTLLKILILFEIIVSMFILFGFFAEGYLAITGFRAGTGHSCSWIFAFLYILMFIVIALAAGYSRLRLPAEPLIFLTSLKFWTAFVQKIQFNRLSGRLFRYQTTRI